MRTRQRVRGLSWAILILGTSRLSSAGEIEIVCHRGANEYAPENTRAAAQICVDWGVDYIEIDVRRSRDGVMYILHDTTVDRTTDGSGPIAAMTAEAIDRLDAGSWFDPKFAGEGVPRLEPYLRWIKGKAKVYFDVKDADLEALIGLVYEVGMEQDCFFWFGDDALARRFRHLDGRLPLKINVATPQDVARAHEEFDAQIVEARLGQMSPALVEACRARGIKLMIYHPEKDAQAFRDVIAWGADMINLNNADLFMAVQRETLAEAPAARP